MSVKSNKSEIFHKRVNINEISFLLSCFDVVERKYVMCLCVFVLCVLYYVFVWIIPDVDKVTIIFNKLQSYMF